MAERVGLDFVRLVTLTGQHKFKRTNSRWATKNRSTNIKLPGPGKSLWGSQLRLPCDQLSNFPSGSHSIPAASDFFFKLCLFLLPAWGKPFSHLSLPYPGTLQPSGLLDPETLVSTIWHLSSYFISICPPHVHLQHKHKSPRLTGHCWQTKLISFRFPAHDHWWEPEFHGSLGNSDRGNHVDAVWSWNQSVVLAAFEVWSTTGAYTSKFTEICNKGDDLQVRHAAGRNMLLRIHRGRWHHFNINMFIVQTETHETLHKRHL